MTPADRPVVITGASSGIGEASARALSAAGHPVVLGARRLDRCRQLAEELTRQGGTAHAFALDVTDPASRDLFVKLAQQAVGDVEVLVTNAGANAPSSAMAATETAFLHHLNVNVLGAHALTQAFGRGMIERGHGDLVFVTSEVVRAPRPWMTPYVTSKFAIEGLVTALMMELEGTGVRVSCIRPGQTLTEMGMDWDPQQAGELLTSWAKWGFARHPHFLTPAGIAAAVVAVVGAPPGVNFAYVDVEPVPPQRKNKEQA